LHAARTDAGTMPRPRTRPGSRDRSACMWSGTHPTHDGPAPRTQGQHRIRQGPYPRRNPVGAGPDRWV